MSRRRVVTGTSNGKSVIVSDGPVPVAWDFVNVPGLSSAHVWTTPANATVPFNGADPVTPTTSFVPKPGETGFSITTLPPDAVLARPDIDWAKAGQEYQEHLPGLVDTFEPDHPGMHTTDTVDYAIVLDNEIWLELDDGKEVHLKAHDVAVQNGTRHAWRNKSSKPTTMAFVLVGAQRKR